jgi:hypothetical protein
MGDITATESEGPKDIEVPEHWTVLYHGTNLGREQWQGESQKLLDGKELTIRTRYPGLSCIDQIEKDRQVKESIRMSAHYDTTDGFTGVRPGIENEPVELRIIMPYIHDRTPKKPEALDRFRQILPVEGVNSLLEFTNKVYWKLNSQHPVVPNGTELIKLDDQTSPGRRRIVWYTPKLTIDVYNHEINKYN